MKNRTIIQRLRLTLGLLVASWVIGSLLLAGVEVKISHVREEADHALLLTGRLRYDLLELASTLRALQLDPRNEEESRKRQEANADLSAIISEIKTQFSDRHELAEAADAIENFDLQAVGPLKVRMNELLADDLPAATRFYNATFAPARHQQNVLAEQFAAKVRDYNAREVVNLHMMQYI